FFQAEDGIRDPLVTGVQTCALPIFEAGQRVLATGGASIDAIVAAVCVMEDSPLFNAGRGAAFTADGRNELDAAVMDGATLRAGGIGRASWRERGGVEGGGCACEENE